MKILQICNKVPYPLKDGGALAIHNLTKGFTDAGARVTLLAMNTFKHKVDEAEVRLYFKNFKNLSIQLVEINTETKPSGALKNFFLSGLPYNAERFISRNFANTLELLLNSESFDIIQLEGLYLMPYVSLIRANSKAKIVLRAHNVEHEIWQRNFISESNILKKVYMYHLARRMKRFEYAQINKYDLLIPITRRDEAKFNTMGNARPAFVCPYATNLDSHILPISDIQPRHFFYIGSLDWIPNQQGLIWFIGNVWKKISNEMKDTRFFVAGRNAPNRLKDMLDKNQIDFLGEVDDANTFMQNKEVMVVPLFSGSGMRVKIIEAMAAGKVVISTSIGIEGIDLTHNKNVIVANSSDEFVSAIKNLCDNKELFLQIAKNAGIFVKEQLNNKKIVANLMKFYNSNIS